MSVILLFFILVFVNNDILNNRMLIKIYPNTVFTSFLPQYLDDNFLCITTSLGHCFLSKDPSCSKPHPLPSFHSSLTLTLTLYHIHTCMCTPAHKHACTYKHTNTKSTTLAQIYTLAQRYTCTHTQT